MIKRGKLILSIQLLLALSTQAQRVIEPYFVHIPPGRFDAAHCYSPFFDVDGTMWFASNNGIKHYNGYTVKTWSHIPGDTNSMLENQVNCFFKDKYGKFWIGYRTIPGISRFDPKKNKFDHFHPDSTNQKAIPDAMVVRFKEDEKGRLWALMWDGGLVNLDHKTGKCIKIYRRDFNNPADTLGILGNRVKGMLPLGNDEYFLGFFNGGAFAPPPTIFNAQKGTFKKFPFDEFTYLGNEKEKYKIGEALTIVHDIYRDRNGNFWFATYSSLLFMDMKNKTIERISASATKGNGRNLENARGFMEDELGRLWVPTSSTGVMIVDINTREVVLVKQADDRESGLADNRVGPLVKDRDGNIWFSGGMGGFSVYVPFLQQFPIHFWSRMNLEYSNRSAQDSPANFFELVNNDTVAVSSENGISYYSLSQRRSVDLYKPEFQVELKERPSVLVGYFFHREDRLFFNYKDRVKITTTGSRNEVIPPGKRCEKWDMVISGQDPRIPVLFRYGLGKSKEAELKQYDVKTNQLSPFRSFPFLVRSNSIKWLTDSTWLIGAGNRGFCVYNHVADTFFMYSCDSTGAQYFPDSTITNYYTGPDGTIWLTSENGVYSFDASRRKWKLWNEEFDLKEDDRVSCLAIDKRNAIWFAVDKNLFRYNPKDESLFHVNQFIDISLGSFGHEFQTNAQGNLYFSTSRGLLIIDPDQLQLPSRKPKVALNACLVNNLIMPEHILESIVKGSHVFSWDQNTLEFDVQTDQMFSLHPTKFYYCLKGSKLGWTCNGASNQIRITNLSHGTYDLEIKAVNGFEIESEIMHIRFTVSRPFWTTWWFITILVVASIAFIYLLIKLRERAMRKKQEELEKVITERTAEVVAKAREIEEQKNVIEEKNKELTDSIYYAQRIQQSILPDESTMRHSLKEHFVYFRPKDIVSGDFYWFSKQKDSVLWAVVDCTGHGVPGGFMSMLGSGLLNQIVNEEQRLQPDDVLNELRKRVIIALKQTGGDGESRDGMDITICRYIPSKNQLEFAGANNALYILKNGELSELKPDKQPIGIFVGDVKPFTLHKVKVNSGDQVYMTSDGYADQFGGLKGKKFKSSSFEKLLLHICSFGMNEQRDTVDKTFETWKGEYEQLDDVCVVGVKI